MQIYLRNSNDQARKNSGSNSALFEESGLTDPRYVVADVDSVTRSWMIARAS